MRKPLIVNGRVVKGIKHGLNIKGSDDEKNIVYNLSKFFGVTFSRIEKFKNKDYNFSFLQPGDEYREKFNMYNEILLLFSPFQQFDRRALDFVDKTLINYDNRLDKVCIFLISNDVEIIDKISALNNENKDSKLIVPFTYNEFKEKEITKEYIENRLRKYFYNRDLFAIESPIKNDSYFFGRKKIVSELYSKYINGEQGGLFGLRKIGKTSVLYALMRTITSKNGVFLFIDCQNPSVHSLRWYELLESLIIRLSEKYHIQLNMTEYIFDEKNAAYNFEKLLMQIYEQLDGQRILLIFDEIEMICVDTSSAQHWRAGFDFIYFWQTIRAFYQEHQNELSFVVAGVNPHCVEVPSVQKIDNPIFSMIDPVYLDLFSIRDVKNMVSSIGKYMGLKFDEEIYTKLVEDYGGHPFLIRHICSLINKSISLERPINVSKYDYDREKENYDIAISKYIQQIVQVLRVSYTKEYQLLEILAVQGNQSFIEKVGKSDFSTIQHLMGYGILKKHRDTYFITIEALKLYLINNSDLAVDNSIEERRTVISKRRNKLEAKLRDIIYNVFITRYGKMEAREKILKTKKSEDRSKLDGISINELMQEHYFFPELKIIIDKNWNDFEKMFVDKNKFKLYMEIVNTYRIDAHAKSITEEDYLMTTMALKWLEECVF
ncbi:ATP-binding protein [Clostridium botulinum]|uniref:AAA-like domain-containing protein n=1 Tax=Clostridium botulinum TaxID=1491 RepID=UPI00037D3608|nr:AAA-like domain-containing protein [Clostridium botulinum]MBN1034501.1 ATP-binding protein [Clostridium botulinum]